MLVYKRRIRIYSLGNGRIYMMTFLRFTAIVVLGFVTVIVAPAHWVNGSSFWVVAGCMYLLMISARELITDSALKYGWQVSFRSSSLTGL